MPYEIVTRKNTIYLRKSFDRSVNSATPNRARNMLRFALASNKSFGKKYEEHIEDIRQAMLSAPRPEPKKKVIEMTPAEILDLRNKMFMLGIHKLPDKYEIRLKRPVRERIPVTA